VYQRSKFFPILLKALGIVIFAAFVGIIYNSLSPQRITLKGSWSRKVVQDSLVVPYSYQQNDPPAVSLDYAMMKFQSEGTVFVDARYPEDYNSGHIKGAINFPYEEFEQYSPQVLPKLPFDKEIITYCDGSECETSLLLARELRDRGYKNLKIFFGGWSEWQKAELPVEVKSQKLEVGSEK
jgi:rhodanese-related sulfurtransferase